MNDHRGNVLKRRSASETDQPDADEERRSSVTCQRCAADFTVTWADFESVHRSADGLVGYVRCAASHLVVASLPKAYAWPPPPASVLALRAALADKAGRAEVDTDDQTALRLPPFLDIRETTVTEAGSESVHRYGVLSSGRR